MAIQDDMVARYWSWLVTLKDNDFPPAGGSSSSLINIDPAQGEAFLIDPAHTVYPGSPHAINQGPCTIPSDCKIFIPLWHAYVEETEHPSAGRSAYAKSKYNLGVITSKVYINDPSRTNPPFASLNVTVCRKGNTVTQTPSAIPPPVQELLVMNEFPLNIPATTHKINLGAAAGEVNIGAHQHTGSHGYYVLLEASSPPLGSGSHTISYSTRVSPIPQVSQCETDPGSPTFTSADITYSIQVQ
jgi:hypothetical protein